MYGDGLEIAGIGVGMVFLALIAILVMIVALRFSIDLGERIFQKKAAAPKRQAVEQPPVEPVIPAVEAPVSTTPVETVAEDTQDRAARAAAIAVALFMAEEAEQRQ